MNNIKHKSSEKSIRELCTQSPFLLINTPCGVGRYKFNSIGYDNNDEIVLEYKLINDNKYQDTSIINNQNPGFRLVASLGCLNIISL